MSARNTLALASIAASCSLLPAPSPAQSTAEEAAGTPPETITLPEIVVTARRTEEAIQDVPGSVVVLSGEELERSNIENTAEAVFRLPNVSFTENSDPTDLSLSIRGITNLIGTGASGPTNGVFLDGILLNPTGATSGINPNLVDLERVETAFGPQGTAFGRGTIGGAINFVARKPTDEFEASLSADVGSFPNGGARAVLNAPLLEDGLLSARLVAFGDITDGFVEFPPGDGPDSVGRNDVGARLSLRSRPTDRLTLDASVSFDRSEFDASNSATLISVEDDNPVSGGSFVDQNSVDRFLASLQGNYDLDIGSLKSTTSFFKTDVDTLDDTDFTALDFTVGSGSLDEQAIAQEFRFESDEFDAPLVGGSVSFNVGTSISFNEFDVLSVLDPGPDAFVILGESFGLGPLPDDGSTVTTGSEQEVFNFGIYGDVRWRPIPELEIVGGARFNLDRVTENGETVSTGLSAFAIPSVPFASGEETFTAITPNASIKYDWSDNFSTYFSFSTGFRAGGFSSGLTGFDSFEEENVRSFEAGFRASLLDNRLTISGSGYFLDYDDIQVAISEVVGGAPVLTIDNAASARSVGTEIGIGLLPVEGLRIDAQMGLNFSKFTDFSDSPFGDLTGTRLPNAPVHTLSLVGDYEHPRDLLPGVRGFVRAEYNFRSSFSNLLDPDLITFDGFDTVNFRVGLRGERFRLEAFVENALNEVYATGSTSLVAAGLVGAPVNVDVGPTRQFGLRGQIRF